MSGCNSCKLYNTRSSKSLEDFVVSSEDSLKYIILVDRNLNDDRDKAEVFKLFKKLKEFSDSNSSDYRFLKEELFSESKTSIFSGFPSCGSAVKARFEECFQNRIKDQLDKLDNAIFITFGSSYKLFQFPFLPQPFSIIREKIENKTLTFILLPPISDFSARFDDTSYSLIDLVRFLNSAIEIANSDNPKSLDIISSISSKELWEIDRSKRWKQQSKSSNITVSYSSLGRYSIDDFELYVNDLERFAENFPKSGLVAFDTETQNLYIFKSSTSLNLLSFAWRRETDNRVEVHVLKFDDKVKEILKSIFSESQKLKDVTIVGHNLKFDLKVLLRYILEYDNHEAYRFLRDLNILDTLVIFHIQDPERVLGLKTLGPLILQIVDYSCPLTVFASKKKEMYKNQAQRIFTEYSAFDAFTTLLLAEKSVSEILKSDSRVSTVWEYEKEILKMATHTEYCGMKVDMTRLKSLQEKIKAEVAEREKILKEKFGLESINKVAEIRKVLLSLKAPIKKKTKTGEFSTDQKVLEIILDREKSKGTNKKLIEFLELLLETKHLKKVETAYLNLETWESEYLDDSQEFIHSTFKLFGTATGRLCLTLDQIDPDNIEFAETEEKENDVDVADVSLHFRKTHQIYKFVTEDGKTLYATPEHYVAVCREYQIIAIPAKDIKIDTDRLVTKDGLSTVKEIRILEGEFFVADVETKTRRKTKK